MGWLSNIFKKELPNFATMNPSECRKTAIALLADGQIKSFNEAIKRARKFEPWFTLNLENGDFSGAKLAFADLRGANLRNANLSGANLKYGDFTGADLTGANMSCADMENAYLARATLAGANLTEANLRQAYLREADLENTNVSNADFRGANLLWTILWHPRVFS